MLLIESTVLLLPVIRPLKSTADVVGARRLVEGVDGHGRAQVVPAVPRTPIVSSLVFMPMLMVLTPVIVPLKLVPARALMLRIGVLVTLPLMPTSPLVPAVVKAELLSILALIVSGLVKLVTTSSIVDAGAERAVLDLGRAHIEQAAAGDVEDVARRPGRGWNSR